MYIHDTKSYFGTLIDIRNKNFDQNYQSETLQPVEHLTEHHKNLLQKRHVLVTNLTKTKPFGTFDSLNDPISKEEIQKTIKTFKSNKALGKDCVSYKKIFKWNHHWDRAIFFNKILAVILFNQFINQRRYRTQTIVVELFCQIA